MRSISGDKNCNLSSISDLLSGETAGTFLFQELNPLTIQRDPLSIFYDIYFFRRSTLKLLKAPWVPLNTNFEGKRAPKKHNFLFKVFLLPVTFSKNIPAAQNFCHRVFIMFWECSEIFDNPPT